MRTLVAILPASVRMEMRPSQTRNTICKTTETVRFPALLYKLLLGARPFRD